MRFAEVDIIKNSEQLYPTCGNYFYDGDGVLRFEISDTGDPYMNSLILIHELVEELITRKEGITEPEISAFDKMFEQERDMGMHGIDEEPGMDRRSPYRKHHIFAEKIERMVCKRLGISWDTYNEKVLSL